MRVKQTFYTSELARETGISAQLVRNYEQLGFIPPVERGPQGYRLYTQQHLDALRIARVAIEGFGWWRALNVMQCMHKDDIAAALEHVDARHAEIHQQRSQVRETLKVLQEIATAIPAAPKAHERRPPIGIQVGEAAKRVGVRVSALRFWEMQGLLEPVRDQFSRYRLYDEEQVRKLQVVALLRKANYDFDAIKATLQQIASGTTEQALAAADQRLKELAEASQRCAKATASLWSYYSSKPASGNGIPFS